MVLTSFGVVYLFKSLLKYCLVPLWFSIMDNKRSPVEQPRTRSLQPCGRCSCSTVPCQHQLFLQTVPHSPPLLCIPFICALELLDVSSFGPIAHVTLSPGVGAPRRWKREGDPWDSSGDSSWNGVGSGIWPRNWMLQINPFAISNSPISLCHYLGWISGGKGWWDRNCPFLPGGLWAAKVTRLQKLIIPCCCRCLAGYSITFDTQW